MSNQPKVTRNPQQPQIQKIPQQARKWYKRRALLAAILMAVIATSVGGVYADFVLSGTVTAPVGATAATLIGIQLQDTTITKNITLYCNPLPTATSTSCTTVPPNAPTKFVPLNPGDTYQVSFTVLNTGQVTIPTVSASVTGAFSPNGGSGTPPSIGTWNYSTNNLAAGAPWPQTAGSFTLPSEGSIKPTAGGTLTITVTVNG